MSASKLAGADANLDVDYVISYTFGDKVTTEEKEQFQRLIEALATVGLATEVRKGEKKSLLIFVRLASDEHLEGEVYRSRINDWLHGVRASAPDKDTKKSLQDEPLYAAERLRIVYQLITNPTREGGAGITPKHGDWTHVESVFCLHNRAFNKHWLQKWSRKYMLDANDLDEIRDAFGEKVAFYFAFTQSYFTSLIAISVFGVSSWFLLGSYSIWYALGNSFLCILAVEWWKHQEEDLATRWSVKNVGTIETMRNDFAPSKEIEDPVTGETTLVFPAPKRFQRQLLQIPFVIVAAAVLGTLIAGCFAIEIFVSEVYKGPGQSVLVFLPTGIMTTVQPLILSFLQGIAQKLTVFENHKTDAAYDHAITQKIFVLNFITSYMGIFLTAFVYVPFASVVVPYLDIFSVALKPLSKDGAQVHVPKRTFHINPDRLRKQVIYFTVTAQIVNQVMEVVVPYVKRRGLDKVKDVQAKRAAKKGEKDEDSYITTMENDPPEEADFLKRVRHEASLDVYDVTTDFREMVVQYGYLTLFSVVWPLTPVSFLINNWIELRTDAAKICNETQRPTPWRADSIGPWIDSLLFLTWLGSITTPSLIFLFSNNGIGPDGNPTSIEGWGLLLSIIGSEHLFLLVQWGVRIFVSKLDSPGRQKDRAERYQIRKKYLEESMGVQTTQTKKQALEDREQREMSRADLEDEARDDARFGRTGPEVKFWRRQRGWRESARVGMEAIERTAAAEAKKDK